MIARRLKNSSLIVGALLLLATSSTYAAETVVLTSGQHEYDLAGSLEILEDPSTKWTIDQVASREFENRFKPIDGQPEFLGDTRSAFWFRFQVDGSARKDTNTQWVLSTLTRLLQSLQLYSREQNKWHVSSGGYDEIGEITIPILVPLPLTNEENQTFFVRIESESPLFAEFAIETVAASRKSISRQMLWNGGFSGLLGIIILLNILMFIFLKDRNYLFCSLYQLSMTIYAMGQNGLLDAYFPRPVYLAWGYFHVVLIGFVVMSSGAFTRGFLGTKQHTPRTDKLILIYILGAAVMLLLLPFVNVFTMIWYTIVLGMLTPIITILPGILRLSQGFKPARLHLTAWGIFSICTFIYAVPVNWGAWEGYVFQAGCAINSILLTLALIDRMRIMRNEREAATAALADSERKFRTLANATTANIVIVQGGKFVYANKGFTDFAGMELERLKKTPVEKVLPEEGIKKALKAIAEAQQGGNSQYRYEVADPRTGRWYEVSAGVFEIDGESAVISTSFDITDRKLADEQMFRAEKMAALGQIIAGVAHEINNPNNFIYFNLPILRKYIEAIRPMLDEHAAKKTNLKILNMPYEFFMEDIFKLLENMEHGSKRITGIVSELKDHVRAEETQDVQPEQIDSVINHVMTLIGKQVRKMVKRLDVKVAENLPPVKMNAGKIEQVLINLVINAGQAADKGDSLVRLTAKKSADNSSEIEILIEDNGAGIAAENLHQIFEPFYTSKSREAGTGLGLSISQRIIEEHGGSINVESTIGEGTCFSVRLPTARE